MQFVLYHRPRADIHWRSLRLQEIGQLLRLGFQVRQTRGDYFQGEWVMVMG